MPVDKKFRLILVHQCFEYAESLMRKVASVIELICRGMGEKDVKAPLAEQGKTQLPYPARHFPVSILMFPRTVAHRTAKPQNPDPIVHKNLVLNAGASLRRVLLVLIIVISVNIKYRNCSERNEERQIFRI